MALIHRWPLVGGGSPLVGGVTLAQQGSVSFSADGARCVGNSIWLYGTPAALPSGACTFAVWIKRIDSIPTRIGPIVVKTGLGGNPDVCGAWNDYIMTGSAGYTATSYAASTVNLDLAVSSHVLWLWEWTGASWLISVGGTTRFSGYTVAPTWGGKTVGIGGINAGGMTSDAVAAHYLDARIYDHALSQSEINALVAAGPNGDLGVTDLPLSRPPLPALLGGSPYVGQKGWRV